MKLFDLTGKNAIITGSTRGIGKSIAKAFVEHGAKVVISSRTAESCVATAQEINDEHAESAIACAANISSKSDLQTLVDTTLQELGSIDAVVCNAATNPYYGEIGGISDEQFRKILDNNIVSNHWLMQMALPGMIERKNGALIVVSSIGGLRGSPLLGAYNISKAADFQLARNYAMEYGVHNIRTNCIAPGLIKTDFARALWEDPKSNSAYENMHPMRRIGEPDEIAGAAVFLASKAGSYVNGQTIIVDGGATA